MDVGCPCAQKKLNMYNLAYRFLFQKTEMSAFSAKKNQMQWHTQRLAEEAATKRRAELEVKKKEAEAVNFTEQNYPTLGRPSINSTKPILNFKAMVEAAPKVVVSRHPDDLVSLSTAMAYKPPKKLFRPSDVAAYMSEEEEEEEGEFNADIDTRRRGDKGIW